MSTLLFFLFEEGISNIISNAKGRGEMKGLKVSPYKFLSLFLFIDDVLLFGVSYLK
jgi:hypothetical protein